jgi:hypothetical protein
MAGATAGLIAGIAALAGAGGALLYVARRKAILDHAPSVMPAQLPEGVSVGLAPTPTLVQTPAGKLADLIEKFQAAAQRRFYQLTWPEQRFVVASKYLREQLGGVIAEISKPYVHYSGNDEITMRYSYYARLAGTLLVRWPLLFDERTRKVNIAYEDRWKHPSTIRIVEDLQIPPPSLPGWINPMQKPKLIDSAVFDRGKPVPVNWFASQLRREIGVAEEHRTGQPWEPQDLPTAGMPPEWVIDAGRAITDWLGGDKYKIGQLAQKTAAEALEGAERVFGDPPSIGEQIAVTEAIIANMIDMMAICQFYERYRWW